MILFLSSFSFLDLSVMINLILECMVELKDSFLTNALLERCQVTIPNFIRHEDQIFIVFEREKLTPNFIVELWREDHLVAWTMKVFTFLLHESLAFSSLV